MTEPTPPTGRTTTPDGDYHRKRAEDLLSVALSTAMAGWLRRRRRADLLAAAQVHATLAALTSPGGTDA